MYKNLDEPVEPLSIRIGNVLMGIERLIAWGFTIASVLFGIAGAANVIAAIFGTGEARDRYWHNAYEQAGAIFLFVVIIVVSATVFQTIDYLITGRKHK